MKGFVVVIALFLFLVLLGHGLFMYKLVQTLEERVSEKKRPSDWIIGKWQSKDAEKTLIEFFPDGSFQTPMKDTSFENGQEVKSIGKAIGEGLARVAAPTGYFIGDYRFADASHLRLEFKGAIVSWLGPVIIDITLSESALVVSNWEDRKTVRFERVLQ